MAGVVAMVDVFVGLDVVDGHLTEVNVTSPTCIRELDSLYGLDIAGQLMARPLTVTSSAAGHKA